MKLGRGFFILLFILAGVGCCVSSPLVFWLFWHTGGTFTDYPSTNILPTAQYLYMYPINTPIEFTFDPKPGNIVNESRICVSFLDVERGTYKTWSRLFLNGDKLPSQSYGFMEFAMLYEPPLINACLELDDGYQLKNGVHLFEIQLKENPFDTGISYQWAIKIEPTGIPTPNATPSAP